MKAVFIGIFVAFVLETVMISSKIHNYENFDVNTILSDKEKTRKFVECMHDDQKCEKRADLELKCEI